MRTPKFRSGLLSLFALSMILGLLSLSINNVSADGHPEITGGGVINDLVDGYISIPGLEVSGESEDPIPVTITVANGQLSMITTDGLTFSRGPVGSKLSFTGSKEDINNALATLRFRTSRVGSFDISVSLTNPGLVFFPGNGHLYEVVNNGSGISWNQAKVAAESRTLNGAQGYLATVTSQEENDYISARLESSGWMGASDAETEGDWKWVTGPEAGTSFWQGLGDGSPVNGGFNAWAAGEPNDYAGDEDCAQYYPEGDWNDLPCDGSGFLNRYVVEYGTDGELPNPPSNTSVTVNTSLPVPENVEVGSCLDLIETAVTNQNDNRYNNLTLTEDIDCSGETLQPLFNDKFLVNDDEDEYEFLGFRGTFDGNGHTISNINIEPSEDEEVEWMARSGFFATTDGATIQNVTFDGGTIAGIGGWNSYCTGGVVGEALNTTFNNIVTNLTINSGSQFGGYSLGGIVGCLKAEDGESSLSNSEAYGEVTGYGSIGGMIGDIEASSGGTVEILNNQAYVSVSHNDGESGYGSGGVIGNLEAYGSSSSIEIVDNLSVGLSINGYGTGGIAGDAEAGDGASVTFDSNQVTEDVVNRGGLGGILGYGNSYDGGKLYMLNHQIDIDVTVLDQNSYAGGLAAELYAEGSSQDTKLIIDNIEYSGSISAAYNAGGVTASLCADYGNEEVLMTNVYTSGDVNVGGYNAGGLVGYTCTAIIEDSASDMNVSGESELGGLVGATGGETKISRSYAGGEVISEEGYSGGLVGRNRDDSEISESFAIGDVSGYERVGGLVGANGAVITNSFASGSVSGIEQVGGLAGRCGGEVEKSYAVGLVIGEENAGGFLGSDQGCNISDSFWDIETTAQIDSAGSATGKSTTEMLLISTYTSSATVGLDEPWDFEVVWAINSEVNSGYPCLQWALAFCLESDQSIDTIDYNGDSIPDSSQPNIGSYLSPITGSRVVIDVGENCELTVDDITEESKLEVQDPGYEYKHGLFDFAGDCGEPGFTTTVSLYYYDVNPENFIARKYNPNTKQYGTIVNASVSSRNINSSNIVVLSYQITDGGELDTDMIVDGKFEDPVGLASTVFPSALAESGSRVTAGVITGSALMTIAALIYAVRPLREYVKE
jgi:hypothetical protein